MAVTIVAVITADIVNSTSLTKQEQARFYTSLQTILKPYKYEFYRGDSFQIYVNDPARALNILLQTRVAAIKLTDEKAFDIRASIGIEKADPKFRSIKTATGEAFILSGRTFDQLENNRRLRIETPEKNKEINIGMDVIARFLDYLFIRLTPKQGAVILQLLQGNTQIQTAEKLNKSQATINKHAQAAGWKEIEKLLMEYQQLTSFINL